MTTKSAPALDTAERRESDNVIPSMPGWIAPAKHEPTNLHAIQRAREAEFDAVVGTLSIGPRYRELKAEDDRFLARQREIGAWQAEPGYSKRRKAAHDTDLRAAAEAVRRGRPDPGWPTREAVDTEDQELREEKERIGVMREAVARDLEALAAGEGLALELEGRIASERMRRSSLLAQYAASSYALTSLEMVETWRRTGKLQPPVMPKVGDARLDTVLAELASLDDAFLAERPRAKAKR
jgi:hypothetical protein